MLTLGARPRLGGARGGRATREPAPGQGSTRRPPPLLMPQVHPPRAPDDGRCVAVGRVGGQTAASQPQAPPPFKRRDQQTGAAAAAAGPPSPPKGRERRDRPSGADAKPRAARTAPMRRRTPHEPHGRKAPPARPRPPQPRPTTEYGCRRRRGAAAGPRPRGEPRQTLRRAHPHPSRSLSPPHLGERAHGEQRQQQEGLGGNHGGRGEGRG